MNLSRIIQHWAAMTPAKVAVRCAGVDVTYAELWRRTLVATDGLAGRGVRHGDRVAWLGLNHPDFLAFLMACARLGAIAVPLNFRLAALELAGVLEHAEASLFFADPPMRALAESVIAQSRVPLVKAESLFEEGQSPAADCAGLDDDPVMLVYTSGTTGRPKGAVLTQANLLWNIAAATASQDITSSDRLLMALPMFHVGGLNIQTLPVLNAGGTVILHPRFEPGAWLADLARERPTLSLLVPATIRAVQDHPDWPSTDLSSLRFINAGSSTVPLSMIQAFHARGVPVGQVYGATETGPVSIVLRAEDAFTHEGSTGKPALHVEARLVGPDGRDVAIDQPGEIWLRGKNVAAGYWKDPANPAFRDGWFRSGDLARVDADGFYWVVGRSKDMIISGGENIYPAELENVLADCADIVESAVIGRADDKWGEMAVAVVVPRPGAALDAERVKSLFEGRLARYKHPREVVFAEALPKTALGKVQKDVLKERLAGV